MNRVVHDFAFKRHFANNFSLTKRSGSCSADWWSMSDQAAFELETFASEPIALASALDAVL